MSFKYNGKVAVISGGDSGIGLAISQRLKKENVKIYDISKDITNNPIFEKSYQCDISDDKRLKEVVDDILAVEGKIDLLFCNAGFGVGGLFENASIEVIDKILNVNLIAQVKMTNLFVKHIREGGRIVFTGSMASIIPLPYQACYSVSKAGVESFSRALSTELRPRKIKVITVMPGDVNTNFTASRVKHVGDDKKESRGVSKMEKAERKGATPDYVAKQIVKIVKRKNPPLRAFIGFLWKFVSFLVKIFPIRFVNFLVRIIYV